MYIWFVFLWAYISNKWTVFSTYILHIASYLHAFHLGVPGGGTAAGYACREFVAQNVGVGKVAVVSWTPGWFWQNEWQWFVKDAKMNR